MSNSGCYFVPTPDDVIAHVSEPLQGTMGRYIGHSVWVRLPGSEGVFRPYFEEARETGREVEFAAFYSGAILDVRVVPAGGSLTVYPTRRSELDVRTLATLNASLERIASELDARARAPHGRRALSSLRATP
jgi:hypothetical protein